MRNQRSKTRLVDEFRIHSSSIKTAKGKLSSFHYMKCRLYNISSRSNPCQTTRSFNKIKDLKTWWEEENILVSSLPLFPAMFSSMAKFHNFSNILIFRLQIISICASRTVCILLTEK